MAFGGLFRELRSVHYSVLNVLVLEHFKSLMFHNVPYSGGKKTHPTPRAEVGGICRAMFGTGVFRRQEKKSWDYF
jgi:hypothetical protein